MSDKSVFIDTNIWLYGLAVSQVTDEHAKHDLTIALFEDVAQDSTIIISTQVLNECHWNLTRKFGYPDAEVYRVIEKNIIALAHIYPLTVQMYHNAFSLRQQYCVSFWDSLIIAAALEADCTVLYSEDMQHGQLFENRLRIVNPFIENTL